MPRAPHSTEFNGNFAINDIFCHVAWNPCESVLYLNLPRQGCNHCLVLEWPDPSHNIFSL